MRVESNKSQAPQSPKAAKGQAPTQDPQAPAHAPDAIKLSGHHAGEPSHGVHGDTIMGKMTDVAHRAHNPHGAMHAFEAIEQGVRVAGRVASQGGRAASAAAQGAEAAKAAGHVAKGHHGLLHKAEHLAGKGLTRTGAWLGNLIRRAPGGQAFMKGVYAAWKAPGRLLGRAAGLTDDALLGTRLGQAVKLTGSSGRFVTQMGGRIPIVGAVLGGVIGVVDVKGSYDILKDPHASTKDKLIAGAQGGLSGASGLLGVGALGMATAAAVGLTAPVSVPVLLGAAAVTGAGAFVLSFFKKH